MFRYAITETIAASKAREEISARLLPTTQQQQQQQQQFSSLRLVSMRESFDLELLTRFYNELMIPNFPLEEERDDLDDWVYYLDPAKKVMKQQNKHQPYPSMDVLLLVKLEQQEAVEVEKKPAATTRRTTIVAGVAFEYYRQAQCGLLSYVVVPDEFRRLGIMRSLHPVACQAMQLLHEESVSAIEVNNNNSNNNHATTTIKAIFAETNTVEADDAPPAIIRKRHEILYQLGYRHLKFPYIQPALEEDAESFDEIMLLIYSPPTDDDGATNPCGEKSTTSSQTHTTTVVETEILYDYVVDFYKSVTGYDNDSYKKDWYYKLVEWFRREHCTTEVAQDLPWEDITQEMNDCMIKSTALDPLSANNNTELLEKSAGVGTDASSDDDSSGSILTPDSENHFGLKSQPSILGKRNHVVVIGAGIAGLVSTITLAEEYLQQQQQQQKQKHSSKDHDQPPIGAPLTITLIEANPFVGGRIRTVVTNEETETKTDESTNQYPLVFTNDRLSNSQKVDGFAPWPVPIGAEFVHGVDSMANQLIEDHEEWLVHETFDLCASVEEYPSQNSFVRRRGSVSLSIEQRKTPHVQIFMDGQCYPLQDRKDHEDCTTTPSRTEQDRIQRLIRRANHIWHTLQKISEEVNTANDINTGVKYGRDMSLDEFIEEQLSHKEEKLSSEDVEKVKQILESLFSNTAGSSNKFLGIHEASREEWNWEYTESNFRSEQCFNEFIKYYLDRIAQINDRATSPNSGVEINIKMGCPVAEIGSASNQQEKDYKTSAIKVLTRAGEAFVCDKCIVTVPLGVLKANKLTFQDAYKIPREMQEAIDTINMFSGMKAHMLLKIGIDIKHMSKLVRNTELLFCPGEIFSQIWLRRNKDTVFLSGFCIANCRDRLIELVISSGKVGEESKSEIAQELMLKQVQRIFEPSNDDEKVFVDSYSPTCSSFALHDWSEDEFTMGIYSSPSVGGGWKKEHIGTIGENMPPITHRDYLAKPIKNAIWFAGEHANTTTCATVQSAMESGARAANEVFRALESSQRQVEDAKDELK